MMYRVVVDGEREVVIHLLLDGNGRRIGQHGIFLGLMGNAGANKAAPFVLGPDGRLDFGPELLGDDGLWSMRFPDVPIVSGVRVSLTRDAAFNVDPPERPTTILGVSPVAPSGGRVVRMGLAALDHDDDGELLYPLTVELPLYADGSRCSESMSFGWEGGAAAPKERWPFTFGPGDAFDFGWYTGLQHPRFGTLVFPDGPIIFGSTVHWTDEAGVAAYTVNQIGPLP